MKNANITRNETRQVHGTVLVGVQALGGGRAVIGQVMGAVSTMRQDEAGEWGREEERRGEGEVQVV